MAGERDGEPSSRNELVAEYQRRNITGSASRLKVAELRAKIEEDDAKRRNTDSSLTKLLENLNDDNDPSHQRRLDTRQKLYDAETTRLQDGFKSQISYFTRRLNNAEGLKLVKLQDKINSLNERVQRGVDEHKAEFDAYKTATLKKVAGGYASNEKHPAKRSQIDQPEESAQPQSKRQKSAAPNVEDPYVPVAKGTSKLPPPTYNSSRRRGLAVKRPHQDFPPFHRSTSPEVEVPRSKVTRDLYQLGDQSEVPLYRLPHVLAAARTSMSSTTAVPRHQNFQKGQNTAKTPIEISSDENEEYDSEDEAVQTQASRRRDISLGPDYGHRQDSNVEGQHIGSALPAASDGKSSRTAGSRNPVRGVKQEPERDDGDSDNSEEDDLSSSEMEEVDYSSHSKIPPITAALNPYYGTMSVNEDLYVPESAFSRQPDPLPAQTDWDFDQEPYRIENYDIEPGLAYYTYAFLDKNYYPVRGDYIKKLEGAAHVLQIHVQHIMLDENGYFLIFKNNVQGRLHAAILRWHGNKGLNIEGRVWHLNFQLGSKRRVQVPEELEKRAKEVELAAGRYSYRMWHDRERTWNELGRWRYAKWFRKQPLWKAAAVEYDALVEFAMANEYDMSPVLDVGSLDVDNDFLVDGYDDTGVVDPGSDGSVAEVGDNEDFTTDNNAPWMDEGFTNEQVTDTPINEHSASSVDDNNSPSSSDFSAIQTTSREVAFPAEQRSEHELGLSENARGKMKATDQTVTVMSYPLVNVEVQDPPQVLKRTELRAPMLPKWMRDNPSVFNKPQLTTFVRDSNGAPDFPHIILDDFAATCIVGHVGIWYMEEYVRERAPGTIKYIAYIEKTNKLGPVECWGGRITSPDKIWLLFDRTLEGMKAAQECAEKCFAKLLFRGVGRVENTDDDNRRIGAKPKYGKAKVVEEGQDGLS